MTNLNNPAQSDETSFSQFYSGVAVNPFYKPGTNSAPSVRYDPLILKSMEAQLLTDTDIGAILDLYPEN